MVFKGSLPTQKIPQFSENPAQLGLLSPVNEALAITLLVDDTPVYKISPSDTEV